MIGPLVNEDKSPRTKRLAAFDDGFRSSQVASANNCFILLTRSQSEEHTQTYIALYGSAQVRDLQLRPLSLGVDHATQVAYARQPISIARDKVDYPSGDALGQHAKQR
jgi:hypothetical protein